MCPAGDSGDFLERTVREGRMALMALMAKPEVQERV
jgi:hypothetical protein